MGPRPDLFTLDLAKGPCVYLQDPGDSPGDLLFAVGLANTTNAADEMKVGWTVGVVGKVGGHDV
jgi:hypothetical protein